MSHINEDNWKERLLEWRREHFAVKATMDPRDKENVVLSVTTNGNQWSSIGLLPEEIERVIEALKPFLPEGGQQ